MFLPKSKYGVDCQAKCEPLISTNADCSVGFVDVGNVCVCHKGSYKKESDKQTCNQSKTGISEFGTWSNEKYFNCDPVTCDVEVSKMQTIKIGNSTCSEKETQFGDACNLSQGRMAAKTPGASTSILSPTKNQVRQISWA